MPAFTALGAYVAGTLLGLTAGTFAFVAVSSIVAISAAYVTSRIINGNPNKGGLDSGSQGGRIQVPPATNNKIPVVYGSAFVNGIITDARLSSSSGDKGDIMHYCLVLSETCNVSGAAYTVDDIYWGDMRLIFETGSGDRHKVLKGVKKVNGPGEDFENADFKIDGTNMVEVRVYAGNSTSARQIFPTTDTPVNAYDYWPDSHWTSANKMEGLVFAIVKLRYNAEKGFTNLPAVTINLSNSVNNPAEVWRDYMTSDRYGAGVTAATIPTTAGTAYDKWYNYCNELIRYTDKDSVSTTQKRYEINGVIDTSNSVKSNIDSLMQNGGAWLSYDVATGYWNPVIKKAVSAGDPAISATHFTGSIASTTLTVTTFPEGRIEPGQALYNTAGTYIGTIVSQTFPLTAGESTGQIGRYTISTTGSGTTFYTTAVGLLEFDDDNILSGINISSTRLDDLYNKYEAEFFDRHNKDQRAYARDEIASGDRNPTEPDNQLRLGLEFTNNSVQANLLANIELRQSRDDLVIEFTSSHYGIQAQAGDIISVSNDIYGWAPKLFRVMRVKEVETEEGGLIAEMSALEYNGDVYTVEALTEFTTEENIGIPPTRAGGANGNIKTPDDDRVSVVEVDNTAAVPFIIMAVKIPTTGGPYEVIEIWYAENTIGVAPAESQFTRLSTHKPPPPSSVFDNGRTITATSITTSNTLNTATAHGLTAGQQVYFTSATANGLTQNKAYWVISAGLTTTAFRLSLTENGTAIALTNGTGLTLNFDTCHLIYLTQLPANQTGQEYYFRVRVGGTGYYSGFTDPDNASIATPATPWNPNGSGAGFDLTGAIEGDTIYYDATAGVWKKNSILTVVDTTNQVEINGNLEISNDIATGANVFIATDTRGNNNLVNPVLTAQIFSSTANAAINYGSAINFEAATNVSTTYTIGSLWAQYTNVTAASETSRLRLRTLTNASEIDSLIITSDLATFNGDLQINGNDIKSSTGATAISLSGSDIFCNNDVYCDGDLILNWDQDTLGNNILFEGNGVLNAGFIRLAQTDFTPGSHDYKLSFGLMQNGATYAEKMFLESNGQLNVTGDIEYQGGDLRTTASNSSFYYTGLGSHTFNIDDINTTTGNTKTVNIAPQGQSGSTTIVNIGSTTSGATSTINLYNDVTVAGQLSAGSIAIDSRVYFDSGTLTTSTTTANQTLDSWAVATYRTVKYVISMASGSAYQSVEILVTHDGTTAYQTTYADITSGASLASFDVTVSGGNVLLRTTPVNAATTYKFSKQLIVV